MAEEIKKPEPEVLQAPKLPICPFCQEDPLPLHRALAILPPTAAPPLPPQHVMVLMCEKCRCALSVLPINLGGKAVPQAQKPKIWSPS